MVYVRVRTLPSAFAEPFVVEHEDIDIGDAGRRRRVVRGCPGNPLVHVAHPVPVGVGQDVHVLDALRIVIAGNGPQGENLVRDELRMLRQLGDPFEQFDADRLAGFGREGGHRPACSVDDRPPADRANGGVGGVVEPGGETPAAHTGAAPQVAVFPQPEIAAVRCAVAPDSESQRQFTLPCGVFGVRDPHCGTGALEYDVAGIAGLRK